MYYIPYAKQEYVSTDAEGDGIQQEQVGPLEFLRLIRDAEIVFTDSFHGSAFCLQFKKNFWVFEAPCTDGGIADAKRIYSLLSKFSLKERIVDFNDFPETDEIGKKIN